MKKTSVFAFLQILLCTILSFSANAQGFKPKEVLKWTEKHTIPANAKVGDVVTLSYSCTIKEGFHLYAAQQPSNAVTPLTFDLDKNIKGVELVGKVVDGPGKKTFLDDVFEKEVSQFEKSATFTQKVKITADNPVISGHLHYQVCDENMCIPDNYDFSIPVKAGGAAKTTDAAAATTSTAKTPEDPAKKKADEARKADSLKKAQEATLNQTETGDAGILNGIHWAGVKVSPDGSQKIKTGDMITLTFKALIEPGVKYYASLPQKGAAAQGASFDLDPTESKNLEEVGDLTITGNKKTGKDNSVYYQDSITVTQQLKVTADNPVLRGYLSYIGGEGDKTAAGKQEIPSFSWAQETPQIGVTPVPSEGCNLWELIILGLLAGLGAVITPCFYPMIPLTVSYFTKQSGTKGRGIFNAIFYGFSIIVMFTGVALLLAAIFGPEILHQIATNAWMNLLLFAIILAFGLSFLGLFDISLPSNFVNAVSQKGNTSSLGGIFFMAATLVLVSFSCTGGFVAPLLSKAATGGSWLCIIIPMLAFSTALSLPFTILALFPSLMKSMPKSGGWLGTFKISLGFLEIALAFMYLSNADLVKHWQLLPRPLFLSLWIAVAFALGLYLIGKIHIKNDEIPAEGISVPRLIFGMIFITLGVYMFSALPNRPIRLLDSLALLPPPEAGSNTEGTSSVNNSSSKEICHYPNKKYDYLGAETPEGLCAFYDLEQGLEYAKKVNKPVLLDFTGHTCKNCRKVEQTVWTDPSVTKMLQEDYVLVSLFTDDGKELDAVEVSPTGMKIYTVGDKWRDYENRMYGFIAQPYYVLLDHDKTKLTASWDYAAAPNVTAYKKNLDAGLVEFKKRHGK